MFKFAPQKTLPATQSIQWLILVLCMSSPMLEDRALIKTAREKLLFGVKKGGHKGFLYLRCITQNKRWRLRAYEKGFTSSVVED